MSGRGKFGLVKMPIFKSYSNVGSAIITLISTPDDDNECFGSRDSVFKCVSRNQCHLLANRSIDCMWESKVSIPSVEDVLFDPTLLHERCLFVDVRIVDSVPSRPYNKIKLYGFNVY